VKVRNVEVKQIDLPEEMKRAMAKQAEAEREKRSKLIHAEGEFQAAQRLLDASHILSQEPAALQLRYLQTLTEIATERNSTILFPLPMDLLRPLYLAGEQAVRAADRAGQITERAGPMAERATRGGSAT
jgi:regulator of protease activity HflC (stomatin/prohibitin superfamily)